MSFGIRKWTHILKFKKSTQIFNYQGFILNRAAPLASMPISWCGQCFCTGRRKRTRAKMMSENLSKGKHEELI
jgi:hypothetical protein